MTPSGGFLPASRFVSTLSPFGRSSTIDVKMLPPGCRCEVDDLLNLVVEVSA